MSDDPSYEELLARLEKLRGEFKDLGRLSGSLAHEIKNPLSVVRMTIELLLEDFREPQDQRDRRVRGKLEIVRTQCQRLQGLLDDFLRFANVMDLQLEPGSLNEQVTRVLEFLEPQAIENGIETIRYMDPDLPTIRLDSKRLYAALLNLVLNAHQAMCDGGTLTVRTRSTPRGVALDLIDTGPGISEDTAMHMFEAFYTTREGGSGLGLPTARRIIEAHGGRIDVQSELGRGTKFTLEFPTAVRIG